jgi:hypothetical protein
MANQLRSRWQQVGFFLVVRMKGRNIHHFREFVMKWLAIAMTKFYNVVRVLPRWALYVVSGVLGSFIMNLVHRGGKPDSAKTDPTSDNSQSTVTGSSTAVAPSATRATPAKGKGKRGKK